VDQSRGARVILGLRSSDPSKPIEVDNRKPRIANSWGFLFARSRPSDHLVMAEVASYLLALKTLLLFIGMVVHSRITQRKGLEAIQGIYKLVRP
jgi:hypothetical protein